MHNLWTNVWTDARHLSRPDWPAGPHLAATAVGRPRGGLGGQDTATRMGVGKPA
jgi:hypothetical protein